jgi:hypothetical protein
VKRVLGIKDEFELEPALPIVPITDEETSQGEYLNHTFVKLSKKLFGSYTVNTGTADDTTDLERVPTVEHKIKKGNMNTKNIRDNFKSSYQSVEANVLPNLYKEYIPRIEQSPLFGYNEKEIRSRQRTLQMPILNNTAWTHFITEKGTTTINLDLVYKQLWMEYPYFEKGWWVEEERASMEKKKKDEEEAAERGKREDEAEKEREHIERGYDRPKHIERGYDTPKF